MTNDSLRTLYRDIVASRSAGDRSRCPSVDSLGDVVTGRVRERERIAVLDHAMQCPDCRREFDQLRALTALRPPAPAYISARQFALAASLLVVVSAGVLFSRRGDDGAAEYRSESAAVTLVSPRAGEALPASRRLVWGQVPGTESYLLEIIDNSDAVRYSEVVRDTSLVIPDSVSLAPGSGFSWWVRARGVDGREASSILQSFVVR